MQVSISSSNLSDTQQTNESLEDATKSIDDLECNDTKPRFNHSGNKVHHKSPKLSRQQALAVVDVHSNTITSSNC